MELNTFIPLTHEAKYMMNLHYHVLLVKQHVDKLFAIRFIQLVEEAPWLLCNGIKEEWENPNLCKLQKFNVITKKGSYPLPFIDDVLNIITSHDAYLDGYFVYH
jgi:hypothetical protein